MPSLILDTGFETYRLSSSCSDWQSAPYLHTPLQVILFIFNMITHFLIELSHYLCGKLDRGLKVERLIIPSASRMFSTISNLCLATNLDSIDRCIVGSNDNNGRLCKWCTPERENPEHLGSSYICKSCRKKSVESTLFHLLMKFTNRIHSAKSSGGMQGLMSYAKQRRLLEFPTVQVNETYERNCDSDSCMFCIQEDDIEHALDPALHEQLLCRLAYFTDRVSCCAITASEARGFINWVDSSFGAFNSVLETENLSQQ